MQVRNSVLYPSDHELVAPPDELIADWIRRERRKLKAFYVHDYLARLFPEEVDEMTPSHLRGTIG